MAINYSQTNWQNGVTQRNADNFNHMENGIEAACNGVDSLNTIVESILCNGLGILYQHKVGNIVHCTLRPYHDSAMLYDISAGADILSALQYPPETDQAVKLMNNSYVEYPIWFTRAGKIINGSSVIPASKWYYLSFSYYCI